MAFIVLEPAFISVAVGVGHKAGALAAASDKITFEYIAIGLGQTARALNLTRDP